MNIELVGKTEVYQFSTTKLTIQGCKGLLDFVSNYGNGTMILGRNRLSERHPVYDDSNAPGPMPLFSHCVGTGKLAPIIRHMSAPILPYVALYIIAEKLAHGTPCT